MVPSTAQVGSGSFPSLPACPPWLAGLALEGPSLGSPLPTQLPGQYSPVWPRLCFCFPVWSPWSCRAVAVPMGHGRGSSSPRGCARLGLQPLPLRRAAKGAGGGGARDPPGLKHPPPPVQERCIPLCQSCSRCQWHSHGPEQLHRTGTPFIPLNRARTSLRGGANGFGVKEPLYAVPSSSWLACSARTGSQLRARGWWPGPACQPGHRGGREEDKGGSSLGEPLATGPLLAYSCTTPQHAKWGKWLSRPPPKSPPHPAKVR